MMKTNHYETKTVNGVDLLEIGRCFTFACSNRRDIVRRLMGTSPFFKGLTFSQAIETYRYAERNGLIQHGDGYVVVYHNLS